MLDLGEWELLLNKLGEIGHAHVDHGRRLAEVLGVGAVASHDDHTAIVDGVGVETPRGRRVARREDKQMGALLLGHLERLRVCAGGAHRDDDAVGTLAAGELLDLLDRVTGGNVDGLKAQTASRLKLLGHHLSDEHAATMRLGNKCVQDAHGASADNHDGIAIAYAEAAEAGAAGAQRLQQGRHGRIDALVDLVAGDLLGDRVVRAAGVAKIPVRVGMVSALELGALTRAALAAGLGIRVVLVAARNVIAHLHALDLGADLHDGSGPLVTERQGKRALAGPVEGSVLGSADVVRIHLDEHVVVAELGKLAIDDLGLLNCRQDGCLCFHRFLIPIQKVYLRAISAYCLTTRSSRIQSSSVRPHTSLANAQTAASSSSTSRSRARHARPYAIPRAR